MVYPGRKPLPRGRPQWLPGPPGTALSGATSALSGTELPSRASTEWSRWPLDTRETSSSTTGVDGTTLSETSIDCSAELILTTRQPKGEVRASFWEQAISADITSSWDFFFSDYLAVCHFTLGEMRLLYLCFHWRRFIGQERIDNMFTNGTCCDVVEIPQPRMATAISRSPVRDIRDTVDLLRGFDQSAMLTSYRVWD